MGTEAAEAVRALSKWIDEHPGNAARDPEARSWGRLAKVQEEAGEVVAAFIGYTGQNPRKGVTHTLDDVVKELLDVAITALGAVEHVTGHTGPSSLQLLDDAILRVARRAGVLR
jgi:NTP pyrophosphatase (non-canonical NTP hydrolase)